MFGTDLLQDGLVGSPCSPRGSQESSATVLCPAGQPCANSQCGQQRAAQATTWLGSPAALSPAWLGLSVGLQRSQGPMVPGLCPSEPRPGQLPPEALAAPTEAVVGGCPCRAGLRARGAFYSLEGRPHACCPHPARLRPLISQHRLCLLPVALCMPGPPAGPSGWWASLPHGPRCPPGQWSFSKGPPEH